MGECLGRFGKSLLYLVNLVSLSKMNKGIKISELSTPGDWKKSLNIG
jgi:hypothetical protein